MYKKLTTTNQRHHSNQQGRGVSRKTPSSSSPSQPSTMGKYSFTKRRHSHQSKILRSQQEMTLIWNRTEQANSTIRLKHRTSTSFRPLAASTPCDIEQSNAFSDGSPHSSTLRHQRVLFTPPVCCSTPKISRRQIPNHNSHGRLTSSFKQKFFLDQHPPVPIISQRRLQFTPNSQSVVRYSNDDSKRINIKNVKIWLL